MKNNILRFAILLIFTNLSNIAAQHSWQTQTSLIDTNLVSVSFVDTVHGWVAAEDGSILYTDNAGKNWQTIAGIENITPSKIFFRNTLLGFITARHNSLIDSAIIFRTTNGGVNWQPIFQKKNCKLSDLFFINDTMGWTAGSELSASDTLSLIMHTIDGGDNWTIPQGPRIQNSLYSIHFRDTAYGQACGQDGIFFTTDNGGRNEVFGWAMDISIPYYSKDLYKISNAGDDYGCAVGEGGFVLFTIDKWANHLDYNIDSEDTLLAVTGSSDGTDYWAVGKNGCIVNVKYALYMVVLTEDERITSENLNDICGDGDDHFWAVGDNGTILFYGKQPALAYNVPLKNNFRIYPNPASDYINVQFTDSRAIKLALQTLEGKTLYSLDKPEGSAETRLDLRGLSKGIYLLKINDFYQKIIISQ
jgi:hypothetical protein